VLHDGSECASRLTISLCSGGYRVFDEFGIGHHCKQRHQETPQSGSFLNNIMDQAQIVADSSRPASRLLLTHLRDAGPQCTMLFIQRKTCVPRYTLADLVASLKLFVGDIELCLRRIRQDNPPISVNRELMLKLAFRVPLRVISDFDSYLLKMGLKAAICRVKTSNWSFS
jgi:hypothetical protein